MIRLLVIDDEVRVVDGLAKRLSREGFQVGKAYTGGQGLEALGKDIFDVVVLDIRLPDIEGTELLTKIRTLYSAPEVIMLTGYGSIETAIRSMKLGAYDYLQKPVRSAELAELIRRAHEKKLLREQNAVLEERLNRIDVHDRLVGVSKPIRRIRKLISIVAPSSTPVLIVGETGTGKELVARAIHDGSPRSHQAFVAVNASTFQENILESELFGHRRGAFTGANTDKVGLLEIAHQGTFFADEIGDMSAAVQAKFLRVVETGTFRKLGSTREIKVDVRFISATNKYLQTEMEKGMFRDDLFYRLSTFIIHVPPLRERPDDIPLLADYFLQKLMRGEKKMLTDEAINLLMSYNWPGNVRELANVIERAFLLSESSTLIGLEEFSTSMIAGDTSPKDGRTKGREAGLLRLKEIEKEHIKRTLKIAGGNKSETARLLGISRKKLYDSLDEGD
jgi:two-component system response regulator AtoC